MKASTVLLPLAALALTGIAIVATRGSTGEQCSSTTVRPWAEAAFDERMAPVAPRAWPLLTSPPRSPLSVTKKAGSITVTKPAESPSKSVSWQHYERVEVGPSMETRLPHAPGITIKLLYWRVEAGPWLSPADGLPVDPQPSWRIERNPSNGVSFIVEFSDDAVRFHGVSLFDRKTKVPLSSSSSWALTGLGKNEQWIKATTGVRHRADLLLELPVTYGPAAIKDLSLTEGAALTFGNHAEAQFVARASGWIQSENWTRGPTEDKFNLEWVDRTKPDGKGWAAIIFSPMGLAAKFQARAKGSSAWGTLNGTSRVATLGMIPDSASTIELRHLPNAARLQFSLPPPSTLPLVDNLLEVNLGDVEFATARDVQSALKWSLQIESESTRTVDLQHLNFPLALIDATPNKLIDLIREQVNPDARIDPNTFRLTVERSSPLTRFKS